MSSAKDIDLDVLEHLLTLESTKHKLVLKLPYPVHEDQGEAKLIIPYYSVLFRIILYYFVLFCIILHYSVLFCIIPYYSKIFFIIPLYSILFIILYYFVNIARFARNVEWDFFDDFQTLC